MSSSLFTLDVDAIDPERSSVTFKLRSTQSVQRMAVSRAFVLRVLASHGRGDYAVCRALGALLAPMSQRARGACLGDRETLDRFIARTRVTAIENYIDWENIDHEAILAKMIVAMGLPASYDLEVVFSEPGFLEGIKVGDRLETGEADGWIDGIKDLLRADGDVYSFRDDEHWHLHRLLAAYNESGQDVIAWTNAHDSVLAVTNGLLPWHMDGRWGAIDRDGAMCVQFVHDDVDYRDGRLVFRAGDRWIPVEQTQRVAPAAPEGVQDPPNESRAAVAEPPVSRPGKLRQQTNPDDEEAVARASEAMSAQLDKYGLRIGQLLRCWIRVFSRRPDIHVLRDTVGSPVPVDTLLALASRLPAHALALADELGPLHFCWVFKDTLAEAGGSSVGDNGGRINLVGFEGFRWYASDDDEFQALFDDLQAEGSSFLLHKAETTTGEAEIVFVHLSEQHPQGTIEHYLTRGAQCAFAGYWPKRGHKGAEALVARLARASLPRSTPADEIVAALRARGLDEVEAQAVQRWLGPDATLLLPA